MLCGNKIKADSTADVSLNLNHPQLCGKSLFGNNLDDWLVITIDV
jgi:hypothetical protein